MGAWDGKLYVVGGTRIDVPYTPVGRVDVFDIATGEWTAEGGENMPTAASFFGSVQTGPYLYAVGGSSGDFAHNVDQTQRYNMATDEWQVGPQFTSARALVSLAASSSHLYALGGDQNGGTAFDVIDQVEYLDLSIWPSGTWIELDDPLPHPNIYAASTCSEVLTGGEIWAVGGGDENLQPYNTNYYYPIAEPCVSFGVDLQPENLATTGMPGEVVNYTLSIHNDGTLDDTYDISVESAWNTTYPATVGPIPPGESTELLVSVEIPGDAYAGDSDSATVIATSQGDPTAADEASLTTSVSEWVEATPIPFGVAYYGFAQCPNQPNSFYVISGAYDWGAATTNVWLYDAVTNTWNALTPILVPVISPAAVCYAGHLYVVQGQLQIYDIEADSWSFGTSVPRYAWGSAVGVWDGKLYRVSGSPGEWNTPFNYVDIYNIATNTWELVGGDPIPVPVFSPSYTQVGPYLYIVGGVGTGSPANNVDVAQRYDMATNTWEWDDFPSARGMGFALAYNGNQLFAMGGDLDGNDYYEATDLVETLDLSVWPDSNWDVYYDPYPYAMAGNSAGFCTEAVTGGEIWSIGGATVNPDMVYDYNLYHPTGEACVHYSVDLPEPWQGEGVAGETVEYTVTITNTGVVTDYFTLDVSTTWNIGSFLGGPGPIGPGESMDIAIAVEVPQDGVWNDLGVTEITAASISNPAEIDTTTITTRVMGYQVDITPDPPDPQTGHPGEVLTYTLQVSNIGDFVDSYTVTISASWGMTTPITVGPLLPGEDTEMLVTVEIPQDALHGDWDEATIMLTSQADPRVSASVKLTSTALWHRTLMPLALRN